MNKQHARHMFYLFSVARILAFLMWMVMVALAAHDRENWVSHMFNAVWMAVVYLMARQDVDYYGREMEE